MSEFDTQVGGDHYTKMTIGPAIYCELNGFGKLVCDMIKYASRYHITNNPEDLEKVIDAAKKKIYLDDLRKTNQIIVGPKSSTAACRDARSQPFEMEIPSHAESVEAEGNKIRVGAGQTS